MNRPSQSLRADRWRRSIRWGSGVALLALTPKCLLCVGAYLGLGALLGLAGPELCGASPATAPAWVSPAIAAGVIAGNVFGWWLERRVRLFQVCATERPKPRENRDRTT